MVQVPTATRVTLERDTLQTVEVVEAKLTDNPEEAVALTVNDPALSDRFGSAANVMVWLAFATEKLRLTGVAAA
jgi:hypothetical protein